MINKPEKINKSKVNYQVEILEQGEAGLSKINDTKQYWSVVASWCRPGHLDMARQEKLQRRQINSQHQVATDTLRGKKEKS